MNRFAAEMIKNPILERRCHTRRMLANALFRYTWLWLAIGTGTLVQTVMKLPMPLLTGYVIDSVIVKGNVNELNRICLLLVGLTVMYVVVGYYTSYAILRVTKSLTIRFRLKLFRHVQRLPIAYLAQKETGYLMSRISQDPQYLGGVVIQLLTIVASALSFCTGIITIFVINSRLAGLSLALLPCFAFSYLIFQRKITSVDNQTKEQGAIISRGLKESLDLTLVTKLFSLYSREAARFLAALKRELRFSIVQFRYERGVMAITGFISAMAPLVVVWYGGIQVIHKSLTVGQLVAFSSLLTLVYGPTTVLIDGRIEFLKSIVSLNRLFDILQEATEEPLEDSVVDWAFPSQPDVEFKDVSFRYGRSDEVLSNINLRICAYEQVGIVGAIGAGKTTFVRLISALERPGNGQIFVGGCDISQMPARALRRRIGVVAQDALLFSASIYENIRIGKPGATRDEVLRAADLANASSFVALLERGFDTPVGQYGSALSGGQKQLICLARVILRDPQILILDEPTSAIDAETERLMLTSLRAFMKNRTTIVISHHMSTLLDINRIVVLENGRVTADGSHAAALKQSRFYAHCVAAQAEAVSV